MGASTCTVIFFRVFDLADFFEPRGGGPFTHFIEQRTARLSHRLFGFQGAVNNQSPASICDVSVMGKTANWEFLTNEREKEGKAYADGWVRGTLLDRFFAPMYRYSHKDVSDIIPRDKSCHTVCEIYRNAWIDSNAPIHSHLKSAVLTLSLSPYGIGSVRLELNVPIDLAATGAGYGAEFRAVQQEVTPLFQSEIFRKRFKEPEFSEVVDVPNWLNFIALSAIWQFLKELEGKKNSHIELANWWRNLGEEDQLQRNASRDQLGRDDTMHLKAFNKLWERCTVRPFPLRHEAAYYYFEDDDYGQECEPSFPDRNEIEGICQLGLLVSSDQAVATGKGQAVFAKGVKDNLGNKDLCVTDNGCAFVLGNSLVVVVRGEKYQLQGSEVTELSYWRWMFRLLCCMRECFILGDVASRDVRKLRERYEAARRNCFVMGTEATSIQEKEFEQVSRSLLDELAQVASLLFTIEEGVHTVVASRVPFVQEKLRTFVEHLGIPDLLENVNKRRQRLEERIHNEMGRLSQGRMESLAVTSKQVADASLVIAKQSKRIAHMALGIALIPIVMTIYSDSKDEAWKIKHEVQEAELLRALNSRPSQQTVDTLSGYSERAAKALERLSPPPSQHICCPLQ